MRQEAALSENLKPKNVYLRGVAELLPELDKAFPALQMTREDAVSLFALTIRNPVALKARGLEAACVFQKDSVRIFRFRQYVATLENAAAKPPALHVRFDLLGGVMEPTMAAHEFGQHHDWAAMIPQSERAAA